MASQTDLFKQHLQAIVTQSLGTKVSKEVAWKLFKNFQIGTLQFILNNDADKTSKDAKAQLSLAGIGAFKVAKSNPTGSKAGLKQVTKLGEDGNAVLDANGKEVKEWVDDPEATPWDFAPKFKYSASSTIDAYVNAFYGHGEQADLDKYPSLGIYANPVKPEEASVEEVGATEKPEEDPVETLDVEDAIEDVEDIEEDF